MFRQPSVGIAEIAWRWSFGFAGVFLVIVGLREYLHSLPVGRRDLLLLRSGQAAFISQALAHVFHGSGARAVRATIVIGFASALAWILVAAVGRLATTRAILSDFADRGLGEAGGEKAWRMGGLLGLNFFRVAATLAAAIGLLTAWTLGGAVSPSSDPAPGSAFLVFVSSLLLLALAWGVVNWFLALASMFSVIDGEDTFGAMAAAAELCGSHLGSVFAVSFWFGLAHTVAFVIATSVVAFPLGFAAVLPGSVVFGGVLLVTLAYFAVADFLYVGRLAGYLAIIQMPSVAATGPPFDQDVPPSRLSGAFGSAVDRDELILSDVPLGTG